MCRVCVQCRRCAEGMLQQFADQWDPAASADQNDHGQLAGCHVRRPQCAAQGIDSLIERRSDQRFEFAPIEAPRITDRR